jgi:DNA polymerase III subunit beta
MPGVILPRKTVAEVRKLIDEAADDVVISLAETKIRFAFNDAVLTSKLIDGTFPDYEKVIPTGNEKQLDVDTTLFADAVDRVSAISSEKSRAVKLAVATAPWCSRQAAPSTAARPRNLRSITPARPWKSASIPATYWISPSRSRARARDS